MDIEQGIITVHRSGAWARQMGMLAGAEYPLGEIAYALGDQFIDRDDRDDFFRFCQIERVREAFSMQEPLIQTETRIRKGENDCFEWYRITLMAPIEGKSSGTIQNVQDEKEAEFDLRRQAERDSLTDLLNRSAFDREVELRFNSHPAAAAFIIIDIDNFKDINDSKGHQYGDSIIIRIADMLRTIAPEQTLIGRFGGDEYLLFLSQQQPESEPGQFREQVRQLCMDIAAAARNQIFSLSLGVSFYPDDAVSAGELLGYADRALYYVKHHGKDNYAFFDPAMPATFEYDDTRRKLPLLLRFRNRWRGAAPIIVTMLAVAVLLIILTRFYTTGLQQMIRNDSLDYLHEISAQIDISTVNTLNAYAAQMNTLGNSITTLAPHMSIDSLTELLQKECAQIGCHEIAAVDGDGIWHTAAWSSKLVELNPHLAICVLDQQTYMSEAVNIRGEDYVLVFVPVDYNTSDELHIRSIVAFIRFDVMNEILSLTAFGGAGHADIITSDGRLVVLSSPEDRLFFGYNIFTFLQQKEFTDEAGYQGLVDGFSAGETGASRVLLDDGEYIFHYSKLGYQDWVLLTSVPADTLEARSSAFMRITLVACGAIAIIFCSLMAALMIVQARSKSKLEKLAYVDGVTGIASRQKLRMEVSRLLAQKDRHYTLVYTNVDRFKVFNERLGAEGANGLLQHIAMILQDGVGNNETAGRIEADHFGLLLHTQDRDEIAWRIRKWSRAVADYQPARQTMLTVAMSYGVYMIDDPTLPVDVLFDRANLARSASRQDSHGSPRIYYYDDRLREWLLNEQMINDSMQEALEQRQFCTYLQPQYQADSERLLGFEALVRWRNTEQGLLFPGSFIPTLERNGFIVKLDLYMFEEVCRIQKELQDQGRFIPRISFNVSRVHLNSKRLLAPFLAIWEKYRVPPKNLEFEFTESVISDNPERLWQVVEDIHRHGFRCSMDDFGSGYSSLNVLNQTNVDMIKIDRSFLGSGDEPSPRSKAIIRAVTTLAHELGMETVAEGVETDRQARFIRSVDCDIIQGYYYSRPLPVEEALLLCPDSPEQ